MGCGDVLSVPTFRRRRLAPMSAEVLPDFDLEELLDNEVPCQGWRGPVNRPHRHCDKPAALRSFGHGCRPEVGRFKCITCWQAWYTNFVARVNKFGSVRCAGCDARFTDPSGFSDYRPF